MYSRTARLLEKRGVNRAMLSASAPPRRRECPLVAEYRTRGSPRAREQVVDSTPTGPPRSAACSGDIPQRPPASADRQLLRKSGSARSH